MEKASKDPWVGGGGGRSPTLCCLPHYRWGPGQVGGAGDPHPHVGSGQERKSKVWVWIERVEKG